MCMTQNTAPAVLNEVAKLWFMMSCAACTILDVFNIVFYILHRHDTMWLSIGAWKDDARRMYDDIMYLIIWTWYDVVFFYHGSIGVWKDDSDGTRRCGIFILYTSLPVSAQCEGLLEGLLSRALLLPLFPRIPIGELFEKPCFVRHMTRTQILRTLNQRDSMWLHRLNHAMVTW